MVVRWLILGAACVILAGAAVRSRTKGQEPQPDCDPSLCFYPDCTCASVHPPIDDEPEWLPQLVVLSFDDAITDPNYEFYLDLVKTYRNPNGCPITMTYFITHMYNNYAYTNELHRLGNEIAARSVSHKTDDYWDPADYDTWFSEINDVKKMINKYGKIPEEDIKGWRTPGLKTGGDNMFKVLQDAGFEYDSSISTSDYTDWFTVPGENEPRGSLYPFTLDYKYDLKCHVGTCPEEIYPGFWVTPMIDLNDPSGHQKEGPTVRTACNMLDSCLGGNGTKTEWDCPEDRCKDNIVNWLIESFYNHYDNKRAPFGLYATYAWMMIDDNIKSRHKDAYKEFIEFLQTRDDVWIVSLATVIEYMKDPQYHEDMIYDWEPVNCPIVPPVTSCPDPITCSYVDPPFEGATKRVNMEICTRPCPQTYPWLGNVDGN